MTQTILIRSRIPSARARRISSLGTSKQARAERQVRDIAALVVFGRGLFGKLEDRRDQ